MEAIHCCPDHCGLVPLRSKPFGVVYAKRDNFGKLYKSKRTVANITHNTSSYMSMVKGMIFLDTPLSCIALHDYKIENQR